MYSDAITVLDFDNVIYWSKSSSALEDFLKNYQSWKAKLFYPAVVGYFIFTRAVSRITGFKTGETTLLTALDVILRKHPVPYSKIVDFTENYSDNVDRDLVNLINSLPSEVYIVTSEPQDLVKEICDYVGLNVKEVYGNEFDVWSDNKIHGFKRYSLLGGMSGKYYRTKLLLKDKPEVKQIYAVGDSIADKGINGYLGVPVKRYEVSNRGEVISALKEILSEQLKSHHEIVSHENAADFIGVDF